MSGRNYLFTAFLLLILGANTVFLTGCQKDYDGQLEVIRNQIKDGESGNLDGLKDKVALIEEQVKVLKQELANVDQENKAKIETLVTELEAVKQELNGRIDELQKVIDANGKDLMELEDRIEAVSQEANQKLLDISTRIDQIDTGLNKLDGRMQKLEDQMTLLGEKQAAVEESIEELKAEIAGLGSDMQEQKTKLEGALADLQALDARLTQGIADMQQKVDDLNQAVQDNADGLDDLRQETIDSIAVLRSEVDTKVGDLANKMTGLSDAVTSLGDDLNQKYGDLDSQLAQIQSEYDLQIQKIWEKINSLTPGESGELDELEELVEEIQTDFNSFREEMTDQLKEMLNTQQLFGNDLQDVKKTVETHTMILNSFQKKLDDLGVRVTELEKTVANMNAAFQNTFNDIEVRLKALEGQGGVDSEGLEQIRQDLEALKVYVDNQANEILQIKNDQNRQAQDLANLYMYVQNSILAMDANYQKLNSKVDGMTDLISVLQKSIEKMNSDIAGLILSVNENSCKIMELKLRIDELENGDKGFVTREQVEEMLKVYNDDIEGKISEVFARLENCVTKDDVDKLVNEAVQSALEGMKSDIEGLTDQYKILNEKVNTLMNRIQSFELLADYNDGTVKVTKHGDGNCQMELRVEFTPKEVALDVSNLKGIVKLRCRDVIPVRSSEDALGLTISDVQLCKDEGVLLVTAEFKSNEAEMNKPGPLSYQVAVELESENDHKLSEYRGLRLVFDEEIIEKDVVYNFETNGELLPTKGDVGFPNFESPGDFIELKCLNTDGTLTESKLFDTPVKGSSTQEGSVYKNLDVTYSKAIVYDALGNPSDEDNRIRVTPEGTLYYDGSQSKSLENYNVIIGLQATQYGLVYGKRGYLCFRLVKK